LTAAATVPSATVTREPAIGIFLAVVWMVINAPLAPFEIERTTFPAIGTDVFLAGMIYILIAT
jgi:hypothetical protein